MRFGFDFHGVITEYTKPIMEIMWALMKVPKGQIGYHEVHLITGSRRETFNKEIQLLPLPAIWKEGYLFSHFFSISDYHIKHNPDKIDLTDPDHPRIEDKELWDRTKADYCKRHNIHLMIDDTPAYKEYFTTPFMLVKNNRKSDYKYNLDSQIENRKRS